MENASAAHPGQENSNVKTPKLRPCRVEKSNISDVGRHAASQISQRSRIQLTHPQLAFLLHNEAALFPDATRFRWLETQRCNVSSFWQKEEQRFFNQYFLDPPTQIKRSPRSTNQKMQSLHAAIGTRQEIAFNAAFAKMFRLLLRTCPLNNTKCATQ